jgi:flagellar biosynthesis/type III secretory pathway protein FliH
MSNAFLPLEAFLRSTFGEVDTKSPPPAAVEPLDSSQQREALHAVRRFRAGLSDALEAAVQRLLPGIARDVVARELELAPANVAAVVAAGLERCSSESVLRVRANPCDIGAIAGAALHGVPDETLEPGDVCIDLRSGTIDLSLAARLESLLAQ